jgi:hypothetical protein
MTTAINSSTAAKAFLGHGKSKLSFTELIKIENLPTLIYDNDRYDCEGKQWKEFLRNNQEFKSLLKKIGKEIFGDGYKIKKDMYCVLYIDGNFSVPKDKAYIYISGDSCISLVDDLTKFSENRQTEEDWGVHGWHEVN